MANKEMAARMREARKAAGLSLDRAAQSIGVAKSTLARWETGHLSPRKNWNSVERVYGKPRLWLEFGINSESPGDPPYPSWSEFLEWLESAPIRDQVAPWMIESLRKIRIPDGWEMSVECYRMILLAFVSASKVPP